MHHLQKSSLQSSLLYKISFRVWEKKWCGGGGLLMLLQLSSCFVTCSVLFKEEGQPRPVDEPVGTWNGDLWQVEVGVDACVCAHTCLYAHTACVSLNYEQYIQLWTVHYIWWTTRLTHFISSVLLLAHHLLIQLCFIHLSCSLECHMFEIVS